MKLTGTFLAPRQSANVDDDELGVAELVVEVLVEEVDVLVEVMRVEDGVDPVQVPAPG